MTDNLMLRMAGIASDSPLAAVLSERADILALTEQTHDAALTPSEPGNLSRAERAAIACRIARLNHHEVLADHFAGLMQKAVATDDVANIADTALNGGEDLRRQAIVRHVDLVARSPKDATRQDIEALRQAGLDDADIVRLAELIAFVSYQVRVAFGLDLLRGAA